MREGQLTLPGSWALGSCYCVSTRDREKGSPTAENFKALPWGLETEI